uniref:Secreted protein n=1 Tax=Anopheles christyi TaxID=43041 RepID=A0A182JWB9_9DIPT
MNDKMFLILFSSLVILCDAIIVHDHYDYYESRERQYGNHDSHQRVPGGSEEETDRVSGGLNFHEVDAFGDDFVDFGAQTGPLGAFTWHANFPVEKRR